MLKDQEKVLNKISEGLREAESVIPKLPNNWIWTDLGTICEIIMGQSPPGDSYNQIGMGVPLINGPVEFGATPFSRTIKAKYTTKPSKLCFENDLILCVRGSTTGRMNISGFDACIGRGVAAIRSFAYQEYVSFFIHSIQDQIYKLGTGTTFPNTTIDMLRRIAIPLPPLFEQHRIVACIEELFSRLDAGVEALQKAKAQLKRYRQAVLKAAVDGRLTEEWRKAHPEVEPAREGNACKAKESNSSDEKEPYAIPNSWIWKSFSDLLIEPLRNGHSARASVDGNGIRTLTLSAVTERDFSEKNTKITVADQRRAKDLWLKRNDILIERSNTIEYVGLSAIYLGDDNFSIFPDLLIRARVSASLVSPIFAEIVLRTPFSRDHFKRKAQGISGNMPKIDQGTIARLPVPLPPLAEQYYIVDEFERQMSIIEKLDVTIQSDINLADRLRQSILKLAFEGKLVPQNPNDEPASVLLERIKAERARKTPCLKNRSKSKRAKAKDIKQSVLL